MASHPEPDFTGLIAALASRLREGGIPFMLIGGQAVLLHGQPRLTEDIDVTLGVTPDELPTLEQLCRELGLKPLPENLPDFVRRTFVLPALHADTRIRVDFIFSTTPYERQAIERAVEVELKGVAVPFATAEDLILHKLFAGRPRDIEDAQGVVRRKETEIDWAHLSRWAREFASVPGRDNLPEQLERLRGVGRRRGK